MRPIEWLENLAQRDAYLRLLAESGALSVAAHRLARARTMSAPVPTEVPSRSEVRAAAREILRRTGSAAPPPPSAILAAECEAVGLLVV